MFYDYIRNKKVVGFLLLLLYIEDLTQAQRQCTRNYQLRSTNDMINITSPNYPNTYQPGTNCRYRVTAPLDHVVILKCRFEVFPINCDTEYFVLSLDGDLLFRERESFCRNTQFTKNSHFRTIAFAYSSSRSRGRFNCVASTKSVPCDCGWSMTTRIANGQQTRLNEFPSMVALRDMTSQQRVFCGGNIISRRHILTAAHCTRAHPDPNVIMAFAGDHDLSRVNETPFEVQYRIRTIINHPNYTTSATSIINDIAILITAERMDFWSRGVGPICLPWGQPNEPFVVSTVDVAGWGTLSFGGAKSNTLQKIELITLGNRDCQEDYNDTIRASQICTYDYRGLGQDSCQYDSGGPVILRQQRLMLLGIISYGRSCGQRYGIGINTRITSYLRWIKSYVGNDVCNPRMATFSVK